MILLDSVVKTKWYLSNIWLSTVVSFFSTFLYNIFNDEIYGPDHSYKLKCDQKNFIIEFFSLAIWHLIKRWNLKILVPTPHNTLVIMLARDNFFLSLDVFWAVKL